MVGAPPSRRATWVVFVGALSCVPAPSEGDAAALNPPSSEDDAETARAGPQASRHRAAPAAPRLHPGPAARREPSAIRSSARARTAGPLAAGLFAQLDFGTRRAGRLGGFDEDGRTVVVDTVGGRYTELWLGPLVRAEWVGLFAEVGYGAFGIRDDAARDDLPSESGDTTSSFRTHPTIEWMLAGGGVVPVLDDLGVVFRLEYRIRYYDRRGGRDLADESVHGTQNVTPFVGVAWRVGPR